MSGSVVFMLNGCVKVIYVVSGTCGIVQSAVLNRVECSVVKCFILVQCFKFDPAVLCSAVDLSAVKCIVVQCKGV